ncbi:MAG: LacI family DNA-binding transcriptional regulator [Kiritimatiellae bacterium]|jgi:LacI family transcriptional regulator|nr:LacI family DNA-binding transcriptional regulator [Kiritimatiellia bacterium]
MATTIQDIAERAGVSSATVSRVANNSARVTPDVSSKVLAAIKHLGYQPPARRPGRKKVTPQGVRTGNILVLFAGLSSSDRYAGSYPDLMCGIETRIHESGLKLMVANLQKEGPLPAALDSREVDGVLLFPFEVTCISTTAMERLRDIPVVCLMRDYETLRGQLDHVLFDNTPIGPTAADYLASRGHRQVAFLNMDPAHKIIAARQAAFIERAEAIGLKAVTCISPAKPASLSGELEAFETLVGQMIAVQAGTTGVFTPGASQVVQAYQALKSHGLMPGRGVDVITCDNVPFFLDRLTPRPAAIDINLELVGARGVEQLLWRMANQDVANRVCVTIDPVLVPGTATELATNETDRLCP